MRDRLIELTKASLIRHIDKSCKLAENIADYLLENGVIVPPCKVGDTVYFVSRGEIIPMIVNCISFNGNYQYCLNCHYVDEDTYGYSLLSFTDKVRGYMFGFTREEAEKALAEVANGTK